VKPRDATTITCIHFFIHGYQAVSRALGFTVPQELLSPEVMWRKKGYEVMTCYDMLWACNSFLAWTKRTESENAKIRLPLFQLQVVHSFVRFWDCKARTWWSVLANLNDHALPEIQIHPIRGCSAWKQLSLPHPIWSLSRSLSIYLSVCLSVYLSIYLAIYVQHNWQRREGQQKDWFANRSRCPVRCSLANLCHLLPW